MWFIFMEKLKYIKTGIAWCSKGGKLVEELRVFLLAAHSSHSAHIQWQVSDKPACRQLVYLQDILHIMDIVDQQMVPVHTRHKACRKIKEEVMQNVLGGVVKNNVSKRGTVFLSLFSFLHHTIYTSSSCRFLTMISAIRSNPMITQV